MPRPLPLETRAQIIAGQAKGQTQRQIAKELGITHATVCKYLRIHNKRALDRLEDHIAVEKYRQLEALREMEMEARAEWERSKRPAEIIKTTTGQATGKDGSPIPVEKVEVTQRGQCANPAYLGEARAALKDIRELLGITGGTDEPAIDYGSLSADELAALKSAMDEGGAQALKVARRLEQSQKAKRHAGEQ